MPVDRNRPGGPNGNRGRIVAIGVVVVLAVALYAIGEAILRHNQMQDCIDSGRRDCDTRLVNP